MISALSRAAVLAVLVGVCGWAAPAARAQVIASNLNSTSPLFRYSGGYFLTGSGFGSSSNVQFAVGFTPATTLQFDFANLPLRLGNPYTDTALISLHANNGGVPGAVIESIVSPQLIPQTFVGDAYTTVFSAQHPTLTAGQTYWLSVSVGELTSATWLPNNINEVTGPTTLMAWTAPNAGPGWYTPNEFSTYERPAFYVYGSVPEPGALSFLMAAGLALAARRRPRRTAR